MVTAAQTIGKILYTILFDYQIFFAISVVSRRLTQLNGSGVGVANRCQCEETDVSTGPLSSLLLVHGQWYRKCGMDVLNTAQWDAQVSRFSLPRSDGCSWHSIQLASDI